MEVTINNVVILVIVLLSLFVIFKVSYKYVDFENEKIDSDFSFYNGTDFVVISGKFNEPKKCSVSVANDTGLFY